MPGMVHNIRIVFGAQTQPSITIQQSDYNSRTIQAACFTSSGTPMDFSDTTVTVVYNAGADPTKEYPVTVERNNLSFTMPGLAAQTAGSWSMQIFIYWAGSLLHSAEIPYTVLKTITPGTGGDDPVPELVLLIQQAQEAIAGANEAASTASQAAGSANSAASSANEKAGIAASAANSAKEAASNAATMASLAQAATANANSAANSASNAAESANQAAASAKAAAASASQVADDVQQKADSGAFNGKNGLDAPQISDTQITTTNPWSSMQIVKTLCPTFTVSGATVQCTPVANYPLGVQVDITPTQEGTGDPSPENVRPIVGWDSVNVTRCGKNLLDMNDAYVNGYNITGFKNMLKPGMQYTYTVKSSGGIAFKLYAVTNANTPWDDGQMALISKYLFEGEYQTFVAPDNIKDFAYIALAGGADGIVNVFPNVEFQLELGSIQTSYEPYRGETYTIQLGQTIYGGTLDVGTGVGSETVHGVQFNGTETWTQRIGNLGLSFFEHSISDKGELITSSGGSINLAKQSQKISHFKVGNPYSENVDDAGWVYSTGSALYAIARIRASRFENVEDWKSFLAAQAAAGTPVTVAYKLVTPHPFQATGNQTIPALPGTNTLYAGAGDITVTGASDPIATITALQTRVSALESAQTNM